MPEACVGSDVLGVRIPHRRQSSVASKAQAGEAASAVSQDLGRDKTSVVTRMSCLSLWGGTEGRH
jgi:hypothetical protein